MNYGQVGDNVNKFLEVAKASNNPDVHLFLGCSSGGEVVHDYFRGENVLYIGTDNKEDVIKEGSENLEKIASEGVPIRNKVFLFHYNKFDYPIQLLNYFSSENGPRIQKLGIYFPFEDLENFIETQTFFHFIEDNVKSGGKVEIVTEMSYVMFEEYQHLFSQIEIIENKDIDFFENEISSEVTAHLSMENESDFVYAIRFIKLTRK